MTDIVERLRRDYEALCGDGDFDANILEEAAAAVERLRAALKSLIGRARLGKYDDFTDDLTVRIFVNLGDLRRARAALPPETKS